jgi:hypothetical protein
MPTPAQAAAQLVRALRTARQIALAAGKATLAGIDDDLIAATIQIGRLGTSGVLTPASAQKLLAQITESLSDITSGVTQRVQAGTYAATNAVATTQAAALTSVGVQVSLGRFNADAFAQVAQIRRDIPLQSLVNRHIGDALEDVRSIVNAGVASGASSAEVAKNIAQIIRNKGGDIAAPGLATVQSDAERIARSEIMNALRAANRLALSRGGIVLAVAWQTSGNHVGPDECDDLAQADVGYGPGFYPPNQFPDAPHPNCACYAGAVQLLPPEDWPTGDEEAA